MGLCPMFTMALDLPHANGEIEKPVIPACVVANHFARRRMLSYFNFHGGMGGPPPWLRMALALLLRDSEAPLTFRAQKRAVHQHRSSVVLIVKGRGLTPMFAHGPCPFGS